MTSNDDIIGIRATMLRRRRSFRDRWLRFSWRRFLVLLTVVALLVWLGFSLRARMGINVDSSEAPSYWKLPPGAVNVSFFEGEVFSPWNAIEFTAPEGEFLDWAARKGWSVSEIDACGFRIYRYTFCTPADDGPRYAEIEEGWCHSWSEGDAGAYVAYDRVTRRAYCFHHTR